jgi:hypothetical protein
MIRHFFAEVDIKFIAPRIEIFIPMWVSIVDRFTPQSMAAERNESTG